MMREALTKIGFETERQMTDLETAVLLPSIRNCFPLPSSPLLVDQQTLDSLAGMHQRGGLKQSEVELMPWRVEYFEATSEDAFKLESLVLKAAAPVDKNSGSRLLAPGVLIGADLFYILMCFLFTASLVERGRFLPDLVELPVQKAGAGDVFSPSKKDQFPGEVSEQKRIHSFWRPLILGRDKAGFAALVRALPPVVKLSLTGGADGNSTEQILEVLSAMLDTLVRRAWAGGRQRGKKINRGNAHEIWISSLGWQRDMGEWSDELRDVYPEVKAWWSRFEWFSKAPYHLHLKLTEPPDEEGPWLVEYMLRHAVETGEVVRAVDIWLHDDINGVPCSSLRRYLLQALGQVAMIMPDVMKSLEKAAPTGCSLSRREAERFFYRHAPILDSKGITVEMPQWWSDVSGESQVSLKGRVVDSSWKSDAKSAFSLSSLVSVDWQIALDGEILTKKELESIVESRGSLVFLRGKWILVPRKAFGEVYERSGKLPDKLSVRDAMQYAIKEPNVDGFVGAPELDNVMEALLQARPDNLYELAPPEGFCGTLRPYQLRGYSWLMMLTSLGMGACLADDMGLGKTVQTLAMIRRHINEGETRPVLLVCPTSVIENWRMEAARFVPHTRLFIHYGPRRVHGKEFVDEAKQAALVITSYSLLLRETSLYKEIEWSGLVLDEAQNIKNPSTRQSRAARSIGAEWRIALTGTPIENHVGDLWSIMQFLMPGLLGSYASFAAEYIQPIQVDNDQEAMARLKRRVSPLIFRRMKSDKDIAPELPDKIESKVFCGLKKEQAAQYAAVTKNLEETLGSVEGIQRKGLVISALTKIKQICDHPALFDEEFKDTDPRFSSKLERLMTIAEVMIETGDRALIFTQYVGMGEILKEQLQERFGREVLFLHGGVSKASRDDLIERFQTDDGPPFFILSLRAGGTGINLTKANHVIMFDRWWNPAVEQQAIDRAHRIGQKSSVHVHVFCCRGTLEERIDALVESKKAIANQVVEGYEEWLTKLSNKELKAMFALAPEALDS